MLRASLWSSKSSLSTIGAASEAKSVRRNVRHLLKELHGLHEPANSVLLNESTIAVPASVNNVTLSHSVSLGRNEVHRELYDVVSAEHERLTGVTQSAKCSNSSSVVADSSSIDVEKLNDVADTKRAKRGDNILASRVVSEAAQMLITDEEVGNLDAPEEEGLEESPVKQMKRRQDKEAGSERSPDDPIIGYKPGKQISLGLDD